MDMSSGNFIMIFDSPERELHDANDGVDRNDKDQGPKIKSEPENHEESLLPPIQPSVSISQSPSDLTASVPIYPQLPIETANQKAEGIHDDYSLGCASVYAAVKERRNAGPDALSTKSIGDVAAKEGKSCEVDSSRGTAPLQDDTHGTAVKQEKRITDRLSLDTAKQLNDLESLPTPTSTPNLSSNGHADTEHDCKPTERLTQIMQTSPEAQRLHQLRFRLAKVREECAKEQGQLIEVARELDELKSTSRANEHEIENNQIQLKAQKAESAAAHTTWKQTQAKVKQTKDLAAQLTHQSELLLDNLTEKGHQHHNTSSRVRAMAVQAAKLETKIEAVQDLMDLAHEFPDEAMRGFVRSVRGLPKPRIKIEKSDTETDTKNGNIIDDRDNSTAISISDDETSDSNTEKETEDNDDNVRRWPEISSSDVTFNDINRFRESLSMNTDTLKPKLESEPTELLEGIKEKIEDQASSTVKIEDEPSPLLPANQITLANFLQHADSILHHKKQIDSLLARVRGQPKRKAAEMENETETEEEKLRSGSYSTRGTSNDGEGKEEEDPPTDSSDEDSIICSRRRTKRRAAKRPVNYDLRQWA